ncbi:MAG TPA: glycosyltransferase family 39 protein [Ktedonobacterales bacterium]|nr:glycosyltransferase family 39 protein [Ktedonobacterales bacterium]
MKRRQVTVARRGGVAARAWVMSGRPVARRLALYAALLLGLLVADAVCVRASLPVEVTRDAGGVTIRAGSVTRRIATDARLLAVSLPSRDAVIHEYQLDGTDSTNNYTLDTAYLHSVANSPYYRFYAWMRGLDDLSRWRDVCASAEGQAARCDAAPPLSGTALPAPDGASQRVTAALRQPETPASLDVALSDGGVIELTIDRNDHVITITQYSVIQPDILPIRAFYPNDLGDTWPQAAMTLDLLIRVLLWALALLGLVWVVEAAVGRVSRGISPLGPLSLEKRGKRGSPLPVEERKKPGSPLPMGEGLGVRFRAAWATLSAAIHPIGLALVGVAFGFMVWVALAQYHAQPHIYDASAYMFGARVFASGRLYAPAPAAPAQFPGPFMALVNGRWFTQYEPGTSATLAIGVALGVPWLVEPLLGALALVGMGMTLRRLYDRRVATLAVALGAISPFYLWLSASYLSHTITLFYLVWGLWALTRFAQGGRGWNLPLAAGLWALAMLTRDTTALFVAASVAGLGWMAWRERWPVIWRREWAAPLSWTAAAVALYLAIYLDYNALLTGSPLVTPRMLVYAPDHWGFGPGVGFYGQHTLAAGFVTLGELLTSLSISLYGWPFYLTLAFIPLPFLARRARRADVFLLGGALLMALAFLGLYYHGIYLGPRYLFEALPFFLGLTSRGIITLMEVGRDARGLIPSPAPWRRGGKARALPGLAAPVVMMALLACATLYYFPRQIALHADFNGMSAETQFRTAALSAPPVHHAIVVTDNRVLYGYTLFGLNDPLLRGDVIYAYATSERDYAALRKAYPARRLYLLHFDKAGQPRFTPLDG